jgi:acyl-CoA dehydrogenase
VAGRRRRVVATDQAMQTYGGFSYALKYDLERYWRESRLFRIAPVPHEMALNYLAEHVRRLRRPYGQLPS